MAKTGRCYLHTEGKVNGIKWEKDEPLGVDTELIKKMMKEFNITKIIEV